MDRRDFLGLLGLVPMAGFAPRKTYSFLGGILRPTWRRLNVTFPADFTLTGSQSLTLLPGGGFVKIRADGAICDIKGLLPARPDITEALVDYHGNILIRERT